MEDVSKVIIIGAPRSGTNILRDVLTSFDGFCTWPCDEINYIWRHGNARHASDQIPADKATPRVKQFINKAFSDIAKGHSGSVVIEKTCANSLRVPFVDAVLPDAKFIFILRDGIDATGSAKERWTAEIDFRYLLAKVKFVPKLDIPYYGIRYIWARFYQVFSKERRLGFWGPALNEMTSILRQHSLSEVCALQWQACVDSAEFGFKRVSADRVIRVRYEDFVMQPAAEVARILKFIGKEVEEEDICRAVANVSSASLGKGRNALGELEVKKLEQMVGETLKRYEYL